MMMFSGSTANRGGLGVWLSILYAKTKRSRHECHGEAYIDLIELKPRHGYCIFTMLKIIILAVLAVASPLQQCMRLPYIQSRHTYKTVVTRTCHWTWVRFWACQWQHANHTRIQGRHYTLQTPWWVGRRSERDPGAPCRRTPMHWSDCCNLTVWTAMN